MMGLGRWGTRWVGEFLTCFFDHLWSKKDTIQLNDLYNVYLFGDISKLCHVILSLNKVSRFEMQPLCNIFELQGNPSILGNGEMDPASFHSQISTPELVTKFIQKKQKNMLIENPRCFSFKTPLKTQWFVSWGYLQAGLQGPCGPVLSWTSRRIRCHQYPSPILVLSREWRNEMEWDDYS